ncbi:MAG: hypothetical protein K0U74_17640 [Alphaproteobacteria bacterium]|nr:hypothetical protein [Alphaproteobacteria bacterium]
MRWHKHGKVFSPNPEGWMHAYAQVPTPLVLSDRLRVFIGVRPRRPVGELPMSEIGYVDLDRADPSKVLGQSDGSVLPLGGLGTFDEFGLHPLSTVRRDGEIWLYYVGWTRMVSVPFNRAIGLAISNDEGQSFRRHSPGPVVGPTAQEPFLQQGPTVKFYNGHWHMWYLGGIEWLEHEGRKECVYQLMHATSDDGISWDRNGKTCLPTCEPTECHAGQGIIEREGRYHMWFSYRPALDFRNGLRGYRIGYAWSDDLVSWQRDDSRAGIDVSPEGWDSEMVCYPNILETDGRTLMFYCGNYFGRDGFGYASLVE